MTIRLTVDRARWWTNARRVAGSVGSGLVPVVKGNGYGFGRARLASLAVELGDTLAVGTVHELDAVPAGATAVVLTPSLDPPASHDPILTVGSLHHVDALAGWGGRVIVKLESEMRRYGGPASLVARAGRAGLSVVGVAIHPPLVGDDADHAEQIVRRLSDVDPALEVWVSHLSPEAYRQLPGTHRYRLRLGTLLWHGDRAALHLEARVLDRRDVRDGDRAGYRLHRVPGAGTLLMIGAGSASGVAPLPDGRSPFHHHRRRLALIEPPHMHTSIAFVPAGEPRPAVGEWVDLQRPLIATAIDELRWT